MLSIGAGVAALLVVAACAADRRVPAVPGEWQVEKGAFVQCVVGRAKGMSGGALLPDDAAGAAVNACPGERADLKVAIQYALRENARVFRTMAQIDNQAESAAFTALTGTARPRG